MGLDPTTGKLVNPPTTTTPTSPHSHNNTEKKEEEEAEQEKEGKQPGDLQLMKEIDGFLNDDEGREALDSAEHLKRMLECSDKAGQIHHPVAKKKVPVPI